MMNNSKELNHQERQELIELREYKRTAEECIEDLKAELLRYILLAETYKEALWWL